MFVPLALKETGYSSVESLSYTPETVSAQLVQRASSCPGTLALGWFVLLQLMAWLGHSIAPRSLYELSI